MANNFSCRLKMSSAGQWMQTLAGRASAGLLWLRMCSTGRNKSWSWPCWSSGLIQVSGIARRCRVRQTNLSFLVHGGHPRMASLMLQAARYLPDYVELAESLPQAVSCFDPSLVQSGSACWLRLISCSIFPGSWSGSKASSSL